MRKPEPARPQARSVLHGILYRSRIEARVARDARHLKALPDDRLTDIGIDRPDIPAALRQGRGVTRAPTGRIRGWNPPLQRPFLTPWAYP